MKTALVLSALAAPAMSASFDDFVGDCWSAQPWCTMPNIHHAVVLFGDTEIKPQNPTYSTDAHTLGNDGNLQGLCVNKPENGVGGARIGTSGMTIDIKGKGTNWHSKPCVIGPLTGTGIPNFHKPLVTHQKGFDVRYNQSEWIQFAKDLAEAAKQDDANIKQRVRFYYPETNPVPGNPGLVILQNDSPDYVAASQQVIHVVIGKGRVRADNDQNNKVDGIIIAPQALVQIHRNWQHAHGFIVAAALREWWKNKGTGASGLQIHGQNATGIKCSVPRPNKNCTDIEDPVCPEEDMTNWCQMPRLEHAVVLFGECDKVPVGSDKLTLNTDSHTYGQNPPEGVEGVAVCGNVKLGATDGVDVPGSSIVTGLIEEWTPNPASMARIENRPTEALAAFNAKYVQDEWIRFANDLLISYRKGDYLLGQRVVFYELTEDEGSFRAVNMSRTDEPDAGDAKIHVVLGRGTFRLNQPNKDFNGDNALMEANRKFSGSIIAPEANVVIDDEIGFIDGFVVARTLKEYKSAFGSPTNSGLQIHGQLPTGITCECTPVASDCDTEGRQCVMPPPGSDEFDEEPTGIEQKE